MYRIFIGIIIVPWRLGSLTFGLTKAIYELNLSKRDVRDLQRLQSG